MKCGQFSILIPLVLSYQVILVLSQFQYHLPGVDEDDIRKAHQQAETADGGMEEVPRGIYHYSDTSQKLGSRFKVPNFEELDPLRMVSDLMGAALQIQNRRKAMTGFELPLPFAGRPMNLQVSTDFRKQTSLADPSNQSQSEKLNLNPEARRAFHLAKQVCLSDAHIDSCDEALDTYHRVRYGKSLLPISAISDDPTTSLARLMVPNLDANLEKMSNREQISQNNNNNNNKNKDDDDDEDNENNYDD